MKLDPARSRVAVYTFAEGLFSALAHDLELLVEGSGLSGESDGTNAAEVRVRVEAIRVSGVMKKGRLETGVLSAGDREAIEKQIRQDVLPGAEVVARGTLDGKRASIEVSAPRGSGRVTCDVTVDAEGEGKRVRGKVEVAMSSLGCPPVKGPMGAFKVRDRVRVEFDLAFR
jgi:hypothetical protein